MFVVHLAPTWRIVGRTLYSTSAIDLIRPNLSLYPSLSPPGVQSHPGASATEGPGDPGEAEGTLRESPPFLNLEPVHCIVGWLERLVP